MKRILFICLAAMLYAMGLQAQSIYDIRVKDGNGRDVSLSEYKGKVLLIVNTATQCGFTPQYDELEKIYEQYQAEGFEILDFPCNQFGTQAPGSFQDIHQFCTANFNIRFSQFEKIDVNGENEAPLYTFLKGKKGFGGFDTQQELGKLLHEMMLRQDANYAQKPDIKWNFTKFLVSRDGRVIKRYEPTDKMFEIERDIRIELNPVLSNIMARRSVRKYLDKPVEHEKLEIIARCGINAPNGMNRQPWLVRVVEDTELIAKVNEVFVKAHPEQVSRDPNFKNMFRNAPNIICVCSPKVGGGEVDAGLMGENIMLAAQSLGLGTCCLGGPVRFLKTTEEARFFLDRLNIPSDYTLNFIIAVGYPDEQPEAKPREESKIQYIK